MLFLLAMLHASAHASQFRLIRTALLAALIGLASSGCIDETELESTESIYPGFFDEEAPLLGTVQLLRPMLLDWDTSCTGLMLSPRALLTAKHCMSLSPSELTLIVSESHPVASLRGWHDYDASQFRTFKAPGRDLAVVALGTPYSGDGLNLPLFGNAPVDNLMISIVNGGDPDELADRVLSADSYALRLGGTPDRVDVEVNPLTSNHNMYFTDHADVGHGASGGPLYERTATGHILLYGVFSMLPPWELFDQTIGHPSGFARLTEEAAYYWVHRAWTCAEYGDLCEGL